MTVVRGLSITVVCGIVGALCGSGIGFALGTYAPDYYRTVFSIDPAAKFDPVQTGIGLGLTQGLAAGLAIGLIVMLAVTWYRGRVIAAGAGSRASGPRG